MAYVYEHLKAILELDEYQGMGLYRRFGYAFALDELFAPESLKNVAPGLYVDLWETYGQTIPRVSGLDPHTQQSLLTRYLLDAEQNVLTSALYLMSASFMLHIQRPDAAELGRIIHHVKLTPHRYTGQP